MKRAADYEAFRSPLSNVTAAAEGAGLEDRVAYLEHGEPYEFEPPSDRR